MRTTWLIILAFSFSVQADERAVGVQCDFLQKPVQASLSVPAADRLYLRDTKDKGYKDLVSDETVGLEINGIVYRNVPSTAILVLNREDLEKYKAKGLAAFSYFIWDLYASSGYIVKLWVQIKDGGISSDGVIQLTSDPQQQYAGPKNCFFSDKAK